MRLKSVEEMDRFLSDVNVGSLRSVVDFISKQRVKDTFKTEYKKAMTAFRQNNPPMADLYFERGFLKKERNYWLTTPFMHGQLSYLIRIDKHTTIYMRVAENSRATARILPVYHDGEWLLEGLWRLFFAIQYSSLKTAVARTKAEMLWNEGPKKGYYDSTRVKDLTELKKATDESLKKNLEAVAKEDTHKALMKRLEILN